MKSKNIFVFILVIIIFLGGIYLGRTLFSDKTIEEKIVYKESSVKDLRRNEIGIPAVNENNNGVIATLVTEVKPGNGLVLVNINDILADFYTQFSARTAASVASNYTGVNLSNIDVVYQIKANASIVGGPSAGAAMTIATIALLSNNQLKEDVMITGAINENGNIERVGAVPQKAEAAKAIGIKLFLIPVGDNFLATEYEREKSCNTYNGKEFCQVVYKAKEIRAFSDSDLEIKEVKNIDEAVKLFLK